MYYVGEVGIDRDKYLYELQYWELILISRGYERRQRALWSSVRWQTYNIIGAIPYTDLAKANIHSPRDLIQFPWDDDEEYQQISDEEIDEMQRDMERMNSESQ